MLVAAVLRGRLRSFLKMISSWRYFCRREVVCAILKILHTVGSAAWYAMKATGVITHLFWNNEQNLKK